MGYLGDGTRAIASKLTDPHSLPRNAHRSRLSTSFVQSSYLLNGVFEAKKLGSDLDAIALDPFRSPLTLDGPSVSFTPALLSHFGRPVSIGKGQSVTLLQNPRANTPADNHVRSAWPGPFSAHVTLAGAGGMR